MKKTRLPFKAALAGFLSMTFGLSASAMDPVSSVSAEFATGNKTKMVRVGAQWNWERKFFQSNGTHLGGYWDLTLAQWRGTRFQHTDNTQDITDIGLTPVFRFQSDSLKGLYGEAGIGAHYLSDLYDNNGRRLSTNFEFGDHLGVGYVFESGLDVGVKFQHFSNGGIKHPNNGVNFAVLRVAYPF
jgi:lipid A 3-O-deacylase